MQAQRRTSGQAGRAVGQANRQVRQAARQAVASQALHAPRGTFRRMGVAEDAHRTRWRPYFYATGGDPSASGSDNVCYVRSPLRHAHYCETNGQQLSFRVSESSSVGHQTRQSMSDANRRLSAVQSERKRHILLPVTTVSSPRQPRRARTQAGAQRPRAGVTGGAAQAQRWHGDGCNCCTDLLRRRFRVELERMGQGLGDAPVTATAAVRLVFLSLGRSGRRAAHAGGGHSHVQGLAGPCPMRAGRQAAQAGPRPGARASSSMDPCAAARHIPLQISAVDNLVSFDVRGEVGDDGDVAFAAAPSTALPLRGCAGAGASRHLSAHTSAVGGRAIPATPPSERNKYYCTAARRHPTDRGPCALCHACVASPIGSHSRRGRRMVPGPAPTHPCRTHARPQARGPEGAMYRTVLDPSEGGW